MKGQYSRAFKIEAVRLAFEDGEGVTQTARKLEVCFGSASNGHRP